MPAVRSTVTIQALVSILGVIQGVSALVSHKLVATSEVSTFNISRTAAIDGCQFKLWDDNLGEDLSTIDVTRLTLNVWYSQSHRGHSYSTQNLDTDLSRGRCVMALGGLPPGRYLVGGRTKAPREFWSYSYTVLYVSRHYADRSSDLQIIGDLEEVVRPNTNVGIECTTVAGDQCKCLVNKRWGYRRKETTTPRQRSTCEASVQLTGTVGGILWCCDVGIPREVEDCADARNALGKIIVISTPPSQQPRLELRKRRYEAGEVLEVTCTVAVSAPPADIMWYFGDYRIAGDEVENIPEERWRWSWDGGSRKAIMRMPLREEDDGKTVACDATHVNGARLRREETIQVVRPILVPQPSPRPPPSRRTTTTTPRTTTTLATTTHITTPLTTTTTTTTPTTTSPATTTPTTHSTSHPSSTKSTLPPPPPSPLSYQPTSPEVSVITEVPEENAPTTQNAKAVDFEATVTTVIAASAGVIAAGFLCLCSVLWFYFKRNGRLLRRALQNTSQTPQRLQMGNINRSYLPHEEVTGVRAPQPLPRPGQRQDSDIYDDIVVPPEYLVVLPPLEHRHEMITTEDYETPIKGANHYDEVYDHVPQPYLSLPPPQRPPPPRPNTSTSNT